MPEPEMQPHQADLDDLLEVLTGKTSKDPLSETQKYIQAHPDSAQGYFILGVLTYLSGYVGDAIEMMERAHELNPDVSEYAKALSSLYTKADRLNDALYFAKLGTVLESDPRMAGVLPPDLHNFIETASQTDLHKHYISASLAFNRRQYELAANECLLDLKMDPSYVPALDVYARALCEMRDFGGAIEAYQRLLNLKTEDTAPYEYGMARAITGLGLIDEAKPYMERALKQGAQDVDVLVGLYRIYSSVPGLESMLEKVRIALDAAGVRKQEPYYSYEKPTDNKIRIGFLSDRCFDCFEGAALSSLLKRFDCNVFDPFVYIQNTNTDNVTQTIINNAISARDVFDINDKTLSLIFKRDEIDVLVDMCGHGPGQRLELLAHQPAGKRLSWLAPYHGGSQPGIDCVITDELTNSWEMRYLGDDQKTLKLDCPIVARPPIRGYPDPGPSPVQSNGYVTFGAHLDFLALSGEEGALWGMLLDEIPGARLRLDIGNQISDIGLARLNELFEPLGLLDRVDLYAPDDDQQLGGFYNDIDIYLPTPSTSNNQVMEALWMGVPCLVYSNLNAGVPYCGAVVRSAGIPSWVDLDKDGMVKLATQLVGDVNELTGLRLALRHQLTKSALMNLDGFAMEFQKQVAGAFFEDAQKGDV